MGGARGASSRSEHPIRVNGFTFDPLVAEAPIPPGLKAGAVADDETGYFLVQFRGPITRPMQDSVVAAGGRPLHFVHENSLVVRAKGTELSAIRRLPDVRWVGAFHPAYKLSPHLSTADDASITAEMRKQRREAGDSSPIPPVDTRMTIRVRIVTMEPSAAGAVADQVRLLGGSGVRVSVQAPGLVTAEVPRPALERIAREPGVLWIERQSPYWAMNDVARWTIQSGDSSTHATPLHDHHIEGTGQTVTIGDTGIDYDHPAFSDPSNAPGPLHRKLTAYYIPPGADGDTSDAGGNHGTHVSGSVAGDAGVWHRYDGDPNASGGSAGPHDGQAHDAKIQVQDISFDAAGSGVYPPDDFHNLFSPAVAAGSFIHTNSWGGGGGAPYGSDQQETDDFVWNNQNLLVLFAAANNGPNLGSVSAQASAKNVIAVGATSNGTGENDMADFSSRGPTVDGRLKPDVVAPGVSIWSAEGCDPGSPCTTYVTKSGTSMATPTVAGAAALLRQYFSDGWYPTGLKTPGNSRTPSAALLKAMLINSAVEINGFEAYQNGETFYPNHSQGWGRIKLDDVAYFKGNSRRLWILDQGTGLGTGQSYTTTLKVTDPTQPLKVTLVWSDYPSIPQSTPALVNNLNLVVHAPNGSVYLGNRFTGYNPSESELYTLPPLDDPGDIDNNVEEVLVRSGVQMCGAGYTIEVQAAEVGVPQCETCSDPPDAQPFALVVTGGIEPDTDGDGAGDCADADDDGDGDPDATDCKPLDARAGHGIVEGTVAAGGSATACQDGIDNDCDGTVDLDCAIDVRTTGGQWLGPGAVDSGTQANMTASSAPNTYEVLKETAVIKQLVAIWTFNVSADSAAYDLNVEAFHSNTAGSDDWNVSYLQKSDTSQCNNNLTGWTPLFTVTKTADDDVLQRASIGSLSPGVVCIRAADSKPSNDTQADKLTLDRVFLFPTPQCTDADGDGYPASCSACVSSNCPLVDCDDHDGTVHPGPRERSLGGPLCTDGDDNDCDGLIDGADPGCQPPPPDVKAGVEQTLVGSVVGEASYVDTWTDDSVEEVLQENGSSGLTHIWSFFNVPDGYSHALNYQARRPNNADGDNFKLMWSFDQVNWNEVGTGALINKSLEFNGVGTITGTGWPRTVYVRVQDTAGGSNSDTVKFDYLAISTTP